MNTIPLAHIHGVDEVRLDQIAMPEASPQDIVVKVLQCGICGSDLSFIAMGGLFGPGNPMPIGHELVGVIHQVGSDVKNWQVGERVVINPEGGGNRIGCSGPEGAFSPFLLVRNVTSDDNIVFKVPDSLSDEQAALIEPLSVAMHAVHQVGIGNAREKAERKAVVMGAGPIGLGIVLVLQYYDIKDIVVVDLSESRLAMARQLGAEVFNPQGDDLSAGLQKLQGSSEFMGGPVPDSDIYFEATGVGPVFNQLVNTAKPGAKVAVVGVHKEEVQLNLVNLLLRELQIVGSMAYTTEFPQVIEMLQKADFDATQIITQRFALSDFQQAVETAKNTDTAIKVLVDCQA